MFRGKKYQNSAKQIDRATLYEDEDGRGGSLGDEGKGAVGVDGDDDRDNHAHVILRALVELLGKSGDVDAVLAQGGTNGGSGRRLARGNLQLNVAYDFLCHVRHLLV